MSPTIQQVEEKRKEIIALLIPERDRLNALIAQFGGESEIIEKKSRTCSKCGGTDHNARSCKVSPSETTE